ncbi:hypothetical protein MtrunA17_Chr4g0055681 [Medicago truncatula]|uniref:Uncharacterized protein n=1 Tax=Medicago truncatula TaxID=3880 RepID=A0A396IG31_MEDTR|nr:hypothetical protein MtrunA17_Chr4g0055681 [Medicago truncatula]
MLLVKHIDWVFMDNSDQEGLNKEGGNMDVPEIATIQKSGNSSTLSLHNSFDLLHEESELPSGEAQLSDKDLNHISKVTLIDSAEIVDKVSEEIVSLSQAAYYKDSDALKSVSYESANLITNNTLPTSVPTSPFQCIKTERLLFLGAATVYASSARDPTLDMQIVPPAPASLGDFILSPIIAFITTTDENLGPDKGKVAQYANVVNNFEACRKSENILRKFWTDDLDTDQTSDSTLELDNTE